MWYLPGPGIKPVSPASADRFLSRKVLSLLSLPTISLSLTHTHRLIYLSITFYILLTIYFLLTTRWCCFLLHYHGKLTIVYSEMQPNILFIAWAIQLRIFEWFNQCGLWHWRWKQMDNSILTVVQFLALGRELSLEMKPLPQEWVFTKWLVKSYIICSV